MVRIERHIKYAADGSALSEVQKLIPVVYLDLPLQTASAYKNAFPDNDVKITAQDGRVMAPMAVVHVPRPRRSATLTTVKPMSAAATGDLSAALS
jgi:hypothetical protein